jgi:hypothetical protein
MQRILCLEQGETDVSVHRGRAQAWVVLNEEDIWKG